MIGILTKCEGKMAGHWSISCYVSYVVSSETHLQTLISTKGVLDNSVLVMRF